MWGAVTWLSDAEGTVTNLPVFGSASPMRKVTEAVAFDAARGRPRYVELASEKFLTYATDNGWNNQLLNLLCALDMARLVNRTLVVRQEGVFDLWPVGRMRATCEVAVALVPPPLSLPLRLTNRCRMAVL